MPLASLKSWITPNELFHILTIMANPLPSIDPSGWRLSVEGLVERPLGRWSPGRSGREA